MLRLDDAELAIDTAGVLTSGDIILPLTLRYLVIFLFKFEFQFTLAVGVVGPVRVPASNCVSCVLGSCSILYSLITSFISLGEIAPLVGMCAFSVASNKYGRCGTDVVGLEGKLYGASRLVILCHSDAPIDFDVSPIAALIAPNDISLLLGIC